MNPVTHYFNAEKFESLFFIGIGMIAILIGVLLVMYVKTPFSRGISIPLIVLAIAQVIVGATVYVRSPKDIVRVESIIKLEKSKLNTEEIPRMKTVMKNFKIYRYLEICFMIVGLLLMFVWNDSSFKQGIGLGLFMQSALMLSLDFFAERRGEEYLHYLLSINS